MMALEGIRVLDLTRFAPGFYCTMMLGDLGADVLRVDMPAGTLEGEGGEVAESRAAAALAVNRDKRSIVLNLKSPDALKVFRKLCAVSDVIVEGYRPGATRRLGIDFDTVKTVNPRLVYCSISGFGQYGPYRDKAGHDVNYIALAGALGLIGQRGGAPAIPVNFLADYAGGGLQAVVGILSALLARQKTGEGQYVDISMTDGAASLMMAEYADYLATGKSPGPARGRLAGGAPYYAVYETKDGRYVAVGCIELKFWRNLCRGIGREDLVKDQFDMANREGLFSALQDTFITRTADEWEKLLANEDVCFSKVLTLEEASLDPHLRERQVFTEVAGPQGPNTQVGIPVKLSATPGRIRMPAPAPGQHTDEVLRELGYDQADIQALRQGGAVA